MKTLLFSFAKEEPFYFSLLSQMSKRQDDGLVAPAAIVYVPNQEQFELAYNWNLLSSYDQNDQMTILIHELIHVINGHHLRIQYRDPKKWNVAADLAVNSLIISRLSERLKRELLLPDNFNLPLSKSADWYYNNLHDHIIDEFPNHLWEAANDNRATATRKLIELAKQQNRDLTKSVEIEDARNLDWNILLRRYLDTFLSDTKGYTYKKFSRRFGIPPGKTRARLSPTLLIAIDSSESIPERDLQRFLKEVSLITKIHESDIWIAVVGDTVQDFYQFKDIIRPLKRGGGTAFQPIFDKARKLALSQTLGCLIYFTDGRSDDIISLKKPSFPVIWVYPEKHFPACTTWGLHLWM